MTRNYLKILEKHGACTASLRYLRIQRKRGRTPEQIWNAARSGLWFVEFVDPNWLFRNTAIKQRDYYGCPTTTCCYNSFCCCDVPFDFTWKQMRERMKKAGWFE